MDLPSILYRFFYSQLLVTPPSPTTSCKGKTIIVTGANVGLGLEAARHFVKLGAEKVILGCRSAEKGEAARRSIESSANRSGVVEVWSLDLCSYESVKAFAARVDGLARVDVIVENAGINTMNYGTAEDNERTITTNVVSTFLLALLVLPALRRTAQTHNIQPVLTIVSSEVHFFTSFPERRASHIFENLNDKSAARMHDRYNVSKLLEVLTCREICSRHPQPYPVTINFMNPGLCRSELAREITGPLSAAFSVMMVLLARTTEVGSRTLVHAALSGPETHGQYLADCEITAPSKFVRSAEGKEVQARVWSELSEKLEAIHPGILKNL